MKKQILAFLLSGVIFFNIPIHSMATTIVNSNTNTDWDAWERSLITGTRKLARWSYTSMTTQILGISQNVAIMFGSVTGYQFVATRVVIFLYLQQRVDGEWETILGTMKSFDDYHGSYEFQTDPELDYIYPGCYQEEAHYYVYSGDQYEYIEAYTITYHYMCGCNPES